MSQADSISLSGSSVGQSKYSIDSYSLLSAKNAPTKFPDFKVTPAFEVKTIKINLTNRKLIFLLNIPLERAYKN